MAGRTLAEEAGILRSPRKTAENESLHLDDVNADVLFSEEGVLVIDSSLGMRPLKPVPDAAGGGDEEADDDDRRR